jgi:EAL and modified HD-GYP domain-containing signal transduction protein
MAELLNNLPLSEQLNQALLNRSGITGQALNDVLNYENKHWQALQALVLPVEIIARTYLDAINWAKHLNAQLQD